MFYLSKKRVWFAAQFLVLAIAFVRIDLPSLLLSFFFFVLKAKDMQEMKQSKQSHDAIALSESNEVERNSIAYIFMHVWISELVDKVNWIDQINKNRQMNKKRIFLK